MGAIPWALPQAGMLLQADGSRQPGALEEYQRLLLFVLLEQGALRLKRRLVVIQRSLYRFGKTLFDVLDFGIEIRQDAGIFGRVQERFFRPVDLQSRVKRRSFRALPAVIGPEGLLPIWHGDALKGVRSRMRCRERAVARGMPVLGQRDVIEAFGETIDDRHTASLVVDHDITWIV